MTVVISRSTDLGHPLDAASSALITSADFGRHVE